MFRIFAFIAALFVLVGCTATERGAVAGGAIGAGTAAVAGGDAATIAVAGAGGAVVGALIGRSTERRGYCRYRAGDGRIYEAPCS